MLSNVSLEEVSWPANMIDNWTVPKTWKGATQVKLGTSDPAGRVWNPVPCGHRVRSVTFHRIPIISTVFLWYPLIGFTEFRSDLYSRNRLDPILRSVRIRRDSGPSGIKKWLEFIVWDDTGFHDKTLQLLMSELVGLHKNGGVPSIGFFHVWHHRSDRNQLLAVIRNNQEIL